MSVRQVHLNIVVLQYHAATSGVFHHLYTIEYLHSSHACCLPAQKLEVSIGYLVGDCLVAAAFLSYAGPFLSSYRDELVQQTWLKQVRRQWLCACCITVVWTVAVSEFRTEIGEISPRGSECMLYSRLYATV